MIEISDTLVPQTIQNEPDELSLIRAARKDPEQFGKLYQQHVEKVFRYLYSRLGNVQEAEDATAQTFLAAFESFDRFRGEGHFVGWLFSIARNKAMDHFRKTKNAPVAQEMEDLPGENDPIFNLIQSEQTNALNHLIQALPEGDRELLRLRFLAEMSFAEIAHLLHRSEQAVKKNTYRLLVRMHSQLEVSNE